MYWGTDRSNLFLIITVTLVKPVAKEKTLGFI
jgi:hypothetical protein